MTPTRSEAAVLVRIRPVVALALALLAGAARAAPPPQPVSPFDITGFLQAATLSATDALAGGTLRVHGQLVTIPRNTIVLFPATALTWQEVFALAPPPYGPTQTGLALADQPLPATTWQVHVVGNRVGDEYIAGLVSFSQDALNASQGYVNFIDYTTGELRVGGVIGDRGTGQRVRLNDPLGRFGRATSPDPRFTIDEDNPTVRTVTGYPLCVPRGDPAAGDDPLCPQTNRPVDTSGRFVQTFTFPDPALHASQDAFRAAPLEIGDFVTYSGIVVYDAAGAYVSAYALVANLGFFTYPQTDPAYVAIDVTILGVGGVPIDGVPQEATVRTRFEGFSTDPSRIVELYGIDVDPCTGTPSDRGWGSVAVDPGPPVGRVLGRWRFNPPTKLLSMPWAGVFLPATREVRARISGAVPTVTTNGLTAGQYHAPISTYLFPENLAAGGPQVPLNFQEFPFLANGSGPWAGGGPNPLPAGIVGQLSPWPGSPAPTPTACGPSTLQRPTANAGPAQTVASGASVKLDGSGSTDPNGLSLTYAWTQSSGPAVTLSSPVAARPTFTAPTVSPGSSPAQLAFQLVVSDAGGISAPSTVSVTVNPAAATPLAPVASAGPAQSVAANALVTLNGSGSKDPNLPPLALTYRWTQIAGPAVVLAGANTATPTFTAPSAATAQKLSFWLVVTNSAGLAATAQADVSVAAVLPPFADAGAAQSAIPFAGVTLSAAASRDPQGLPLTYRWTQTSGPAVTLSSATAVSPTFTAPGIGPLVFTVQVSNGFASATASTTVTVLGAPDTVAITLVEYRIGKERLTINARSSVTDGSAVLTATVDFVTTVRMTYAGAGNYTVVLVGLPQPFDVSVESSLGGSAFSGVTRIRP